MKVAVIGAGITGLTAAYRLTQKNHKVVVFEKEKDIGGLAGSFQLPNWQYPLEKHYHHWFTSDSYVISLLKELDLAPYLFFSKSATGVFFEKKEYLFNSPFDVLTFSPLSFAERIRTGFILLYLKLLPLSLALQLEKHTAYFWLQQYFGKKIFKILWQPLLRGKFGLLEQQVNMTWFWARIKKRSSRLGYLKGGYQKLTDCLLQKIEEKRGQVLTNTPWQNDFLKNYDKVIFTASSLGFIRNFAQQLPRNYKEKLSRIPYLHALTLIIVSKTKILKNIYWLNINETNFPFIGVIQHTNMVDAKYYDGSEIAYIANYVPDGHPYLNMKPEQLMIVYLPYLKKINPAFNLQLISQVYLFQGRFAQPVFSVNYSKIKPGFITPIPNVYLANMDMVYPWDRGTNYAIELGYRVANIVLGKKFD